MAKQPTRKRPSSAQTASVASTPSTQMPAVAELPLPIIQFAANNNVLYPIDAIAGTTATLTLPAGATHVIFYMAIKGQAEPAFEPVAVADGVNVVDIAAQKISYCIGHTAFFWYVATVGGRVQNSLRLELEVQQIREEDLRGSLPVFAHAQYVDSTWKLDMAAFNGDETIQVKAWPMIRAGQRLFINVAGDQHRPPFEFAWVAHDHVVTAAEAIAGHVLEFKLSRAWMAQREDYSALTIHMAVIFDGTAPMPAVPVDPIHETQLPENALEFHPRTTALLFVDASLDLPAPILVEANGQTTVDPYVIHRAGKCTVRVCYEGMLSTDRIWVHWPGITDEDPIPPQSGVEDGCVDFYIPLYYVGLRIDTYVNFSYTVTRDGESHQSRPAQVRIRWPFPANLPTPTFMQAVDDELDLSLLCCEDPVVYVAPWMFINTVHTIRLYVSGTKKDGDAYYQEFFQGEHVTEQEVQDGWSRPLPIALFRELQHNSDLRLVLDVNFNGPGTDTYRLFPVGKLKLFTEPHLTLLAPELREAVHTSHGWRLNPINTVHGAHMLVAYEGMCCGDIVCPTFHGTPGPGSPELECRQVGEGQTRLKFFIPPSAISANFKQSIELTYRVTRCDGNEWDAKKRIVEVLGLRHLPKPAVLEAGNRKLDLNTFAGDATVRVIRWDYIALDQCCWLWVVGERENGTSYRFDVLEGEPVKSEWLTGGLTKLLPREKLEKLANCSKFNVHFAVNFNYKADIHNATEFHPLVLHIEQKDLELNAPKVREADGSTLTIWKGQAGVTVRVAYEPMSERHRIKASWVDGTTLPPELKIIESNPCYVDFHVPREAVIRGAGRTVSIHYTVFNGCKCQTSEVLELKITKPESEELPTPDVLQATDGILDLESFDGDAHITVYDEAFQSAWWFAQEGQRVWLKCTGIKKDNSEYTFYVTNDVLLTEDEVKDGLTHTMSRTELALLKHDTPLKVFCIVVPDERGDEADGIVFPVLNLTLMQPLICEVERFEERALELYSAGGSVQTRLMTITFESGAGMAGIAKYGNTEFYSGNHFVMCRGVDHQIPPQLHRFEFAHPLESVKFGWAWKQRPATVTFFDQAGEVITASTYPDDMRGGFWVEYPAPALAAEYPAVSRPAIASMTVLVQDYSFIDNFKVCYRG